MANKPSSAKGGPLIISSRPSLYSIEELNRKVNALDNKANKEKFDAKKHKDTKRSHIALVFVYGYMAMIAITVIGAPVYNAIVLSEPIEIDLERILAQVGSLIGAPLGFVIGYYFKEDK